MGSSNNQQRSRTHPARECEVLLLRRVGLLLSTLLRGEVLAGSRQGSAYERH